MIDPLETEYLAHLTRRRIAELERTRSQVESLERRADLINEYTSDRRKREGLHRLNERLDHMGPALTYMGEYVAELKAYLQATYEADLVGDPSMQSMTADHAVGYAVRLLDMMSDANKYSAKGSFGVLELASSTLAMFAQRPSGSQAIRDSAAVSVMVKLLSPLYPPVAVANIANAVGHMATDVDCRLAFRAAGGVGALVRLLRADCEPTVQTASAAALSLLSAHDLVVQDSVRYLGGIDHLVDMLSSPDAYLAEVARYALLSLRHGNVKNQAEIITTARSSAALAKNVRRLEAAADLLRFEDDPTGSPRLGSPSRKLFDSSPVRPSTADSYLRAPSTPKYAVATPTRSTLSPRSPLDYGWDSPKAKAPLSLLSPSSRADDDWASRTLMDVEADLFKKRHLARYTEDDVLALCEHLGFDSLTMRSLRRRHVDGHALLTMSDDDLAIELLLPSHLLRKLQQLVKATRLFDSIATLPRQGKVSEVEVRLHLSRLGATTANATKTIKLLRALVKVDRDDFITFLDFVLGYDWIAQAFQIYGTRA